MNIAELILRQVDPQLTKAGHQWRGPLVVERWGPTKAGWIALIKLGDMDENGCQRMMFFEGGTLYHLHGAEYFHSREEAEKAFKARILQQQGEAHN